MGDGRKEEKMKGSRPKAEVNMRRARYGDMLSYYSVSSYGLAMERRRKGRRENEKEGQCRRERGDLPSYRSACSAILAKNTHSSLSMLLYVLHKYYIS